MADLAIAVFPQVTVGVVVTPATAPPLTVGVQGPPGRDGGSFAFTQGSASDTWTIAHNLGYYPNVTIVDSTGREIEGDIRYIDVNNITVYFSAAFSGQAYLS